MACYQFIVTVIISEKNKMFLSKEGLLIPIHKHIIITVSQKHIRELLLYWKYPAWDDMPLLWLQ